MAPRTSLRFAWGIFHQIPTNVLQSQEGFGNPELGQERSIHHVVGLKQTLPRETLLRAEVYWKQLDDLVVALEAIAFDEPLRSHREYPVMVVEPAVFS